MGNEIVLVLIFIFTSLFLCQTMDNIKKISEEEKQLSRWLNRSEEELKIEFGKPDKVNF